MKNKQKQVKYPDFSVLMSVYKKEKSEFLNQALISIEKQTVVPTEIVLVEDGPITEKMQNVIDYHQKEFVNKFKVIKSSRNHGLGNALHLGTNFVSTDWIARMDSDDISVPNRFEIQLKKIIRSPKIAIVGGQISEFVGDSFKTVGYRRVPTSEGLIRQFIKWRSPFNHPSVMINKKVLQDVGGYIPYGNLEDYYLWSRIIVKGYRVCNVNNVLVKMRVDKGMYRRRGKVSNIKYFYRLRRFLYNQDVLSWREKVIGDWMMTLNILIPGWLRKIIYKKVLHRMKNVRY